MKGRTRGKPTINVVKPIKDGRAAASNGGIIPHRRLHLPLIGIKTAPRLIIVTAAGQIGKIHGTIPGTIRSTINGIGRNESTASGVRYFLKLERFNVTNCTGNAN